jgi:flagellar biosynthesis protein FlhF
MKVKRYIAKDMSEAMIKIKNDMGSDAVILNTRKVNQGGIFGFLKSPLIEVVAAIDEDLQPNFQSEQHKNIDKAMEHRSIISNTKTGKVESEKGLNAADSDNGEEFEKINSDIQYLKEMLQTIIDEKRRDRELKKVPENSSEINTISAGDDSKPLAPKTTKNQTSKAAKIEKLMSIFREKGVDDEYLFSIQGMFSDKKINTKLDFKKSIKNVFDEIIGDVYTIEKDSDAQKVFFFVGPTGVGKTTTLAKISARLSLVENKRVGLITADTYRIAAVEQLRTYSEILGIPLNVIYEPDELDGAISKYKDMDYILIDTAGRSHKSNEMQRDISNLLTRVPNSEIFLVMSATTGYRDIQSIIDSYGFLDDYKVIVTKLDESSAIGGIINIRMLTKKPFTYFTVGQNVPDDIEVANAERVVLGITGD